MKKKKQFRKIRIQLLNPFYLKREISKYSGKFSVEDIFLYILGGVGLSIAFGICFHLNIFLIGLLIVVCLLCIPGFIMDTYLELYQKNRFNEAEQYIDHMLYAFMQHKKILSSLEDVYKLYDDKSNMKRCILEAIDYIQTGKCETNIYKEALSIIEKEYENIRIVDVNDFMVNVEKTGGEFESTAELLLEDKKNWCKNIVDLQGKKSGKFRDIIFSAVIFSGLCGVMAWLMDSESITNMTEIMLSKLLVEQVTAVAMIIGQMLVIKAAKRKMVIDWLGRENRNNDDDVIKNYKYLLNYDEKKEKVASLLWAAPFLIAVLPVWIFVSHIVAVILGAIGVFMLFQHRLNYHLAYKSAANELLIAYPKWLLDLLLLMQNNNVQVSIQKSYDRAPMILKQEIGDLITRMNETPNDIEAYVKFFEIFKNDQKLSLVQDTMKTFYSLSTTGNGETDKQIKNILDTIYQYRDISDKFLNENVLMDLEIFFKIPWVISAPKLLVDIMVLLCVAMPAMIG